MNTTPPIDPMTTISSKAAIGAGGLTAFWGFMSHEVLFGAAGLLIALFTMLINWWYRRRTHLLDEEMRRSANEREARIAALEEQERRLRIEHMHAQHATPQIITDAPARFEAAATSNEHPHHIV